MSDANHPAKFEQALSLGGDEGPLPAHNHAHGARYCDWTQAGTREPRAGRGDTTPGQHNESPVAEAAGLGFDPFPGRRSFLKRDTMTNKAQVATDVATDPIQWQGTGHSPVEALEIEEDIRWANRRGQEQPSRNDDPFLSNPPPAQITRGKPR